MSDNPWIKFYPSDWLGGTRGLRPSEAGIYITIICLMYEEGGCIENDIGTLAIQCNLRTSRLKTILDKLLSKDKITIDDDGKLTNERVNHELQVRIQKRTLAQQSAAARWKKKHNKNNGSTKRTHMQTHSERNANQNHNKKEANLDLEVKQEGVITVFVKYQSDEWNKRQAASPDKKLNPMQMNEGYGRRFPSKAN